MKRSARRLNIIVAVLLCAALLFALAGCDHSLEPQPDPEFEPTTGGTTNKTDPDAPKEIESKDITSFYATFYWTGEWINEYGGNQYEFKASINEDGSITAEETSQGISLTGSGGLMEKLQEMIDDNDLAAQNGVYEVTAGLPPEFDHCSVNVDYASGENLTFTTNNNPDAQWIKDTYFAFAEWFAENGDASLVPDKHEGEVERLTLVLRDGDVRYRYGDWMLQNGDNPDIKERILERDVYDYAAEDDVTDDYMPYYEEFYDGIDDILSYYDLSPFDSLSAYYGQGRNTTDKEDPESADLVIRIEYKDDYRLTIATSDEKDREILEPLVDEIIGYFDQVFEENRDKVTEF